MIHKGIHSCDGSCVKKGEIEMSEIERDIERDSFMELKEELASLKSKLKEVEHDSDTWKWKSHFWHGEADEKLRYLKDAQSKLEVRDEVIRVAREALECLTDQEWLIEKGHIQIPIDEACKAISQIDALMKKGE